MADAAGPFVGVSDYMRGVQEQIRAYLPGTYLTLGTDGFGFSDTRPAARRFFNVDAESIVVAVLVALARDGHIDMSVAKQAADKYKIDDVEAVHARAKKLGVLAPFAVHDQPAGEVIDRPWGERSFYVTDKWGNELCFVKEGTLYT